MRNDHPEKAKAKSKKAKTKKTEAKKAKTNWIKKNFGGKPRPEALERLKREKEALPVSNPLALLARQQSQSPVSLLARQQSQSPVSLLARQQNIFMPFIERQRMMERFVKQYSMIGQSIRELKQLQTPHYDVGLLGAQEARRIRQSLILPSRNIVTSEQDMLLRTFREMERTQRWAEQSRSQLRMGEEFGRQLFEEQRRAEQFRSLYLSQASLPGQEIRWFLEQQEQNRRVMQEIEEFLEQQKTSEEDATDRIIKPSEAQRYWKARQWFQWIWQWLKWIRQVPNKGDWLSEMMDFEKLLQFSQELIQYLVM